MEKRTRGERRALTRRHVDRQQRLYIQYHQHVWETGYEITEWMLGYWRNHSFRDCGRAQCQMCMNPRRVKWNPINLRITRQERKNRDLYNAQIEDYFINGLD